MEKLSELVIGVSNVQLEVTNTPVFPPGFRRMFEVLKESLRVSTLGLFVFFRLKTKMAC